MNAEAVSGGDGPVADAVAIIKRCPPFTLIQEDDRHEQQELLKCLAELHTYETAVLRKAVEQFITEDRDAFVSVDDMSKLFVLNRYIFNIPATAKGKEVRPFGGWVLPYDDGKGEMDLLWPFRIVENDQLELVGFGVGYMGETFRAVAEFDLFNERFGRRQQ